MLQDMLSQAIAALPESVGPRLHPEFISRRPQPPGNLQGNGGLLGQLRWHARSELFQGPCSAPAGERGRRTRRFEEFLESSEPFCLTAARGAGDNSNRHVCGDRRPYFSDTGGRHAEPEDKKANSPSLSLGLPASGRPDKEPRSPFPTLRGLWKRCLTGLQPNRKRAASPFQSRRNSNLDIGLTGLTMDIAGRVPTCENEDPKKGTFYFSAFRGRPRGRRLASRPKKGDILLFRLPRPAARTQARLQTQALRRSLHPARFAHYARRNAGRSTNVGPPEWRIGGLEGPSAPRWETVSGYNQLVSKKKSPDRG